MDIVKIANHKVSPLNSYFFDTNVWLFIYGPVAGTNVRKQDAYSALLRDIIDLKATIYISSLVLAEYINAVLRIGFLNWKQKTRNTTADYKRDYRPTEDYNNTLKDAISQIEDILKITQKKPDDFNSINISDVLGRMSNKADFNDVYIAKACECRSSVKLVSDDTDLQSLGINVMLITA